MPESTSASAATALPDRSWSTPARAYAPSATGFIQAERAASGGAPQRERHGVVRDSVGPARHVLVHGPHQLLRRERAREPRHKLREALAAVHNALTARLDQAVRVGEDEIAAFEMQFALGVVMALEDAERQPVAVERADGAGPHVQRRQVPGVAVSERLARE